MPAYPDTDQPDRQNAAALYAEGKTVKQVADALGSTYHKTRNALKAAGVLRRKGGHAQIDEAAVVARYGVLRASEPVATEFGCTPELVLQLVRAAGEAVTPRGGKRLYAYDETFFDSYTPASCYWAGFLAADGCLVLSKGAHRTQVGPLARVDRTHLESFRSSSGTEHPINDVMCGEHPESNMIVSSRPWWDALHERFNLEQRKSLVLKPPPADILEEMLWHYVRGYFDGDGGVGMNNDPSGNPKQINWASGSYAWLLWLRRFIESHHKIGGSPGKYRLWISGPVLRRVVPLLYAGSTPDTRLGRKYERLKKHIGGEHG